MADLPTTATSAPAAASTAPATAQGTLQPRELHSPRVMHVNVFFDGVILTLSMIAALLFIRLYRKGHDRFYLFLAASFIVYGFNRIIFQFFIHADDDIKLSLYSIRFVSFGLVFIGLLDKKFRSSRSTSPSSPS